MTPVISRALGRIVARFDLSPANQDYLTSQVPVDATTEADLPSHLRELLAESRQPGRTDAQQRDRTLQLATRAS